MHKSMLSTRPHAGDVVGYWRNGREIRLPGGGSTPPEPPQTPPTNAPEGTVRVTIPPTAPAAPQMLTAEDLQRERERLENEFNTRLADREAELQRGFNERLGPIEAERAQRAQEAQEAADRAAEAERARIAAEETSAQRAERMAQETQTQLSALQEQLATKDALLAREAEYNAVQEYRRQQIQAHNETIYPALVNTIRGNTQAEVDESIRLAEAASMELLADFNAVQGGQQAAAEQARRAALGVSPTLPAAGPLEMQPTTRELTPEQIKNLSGAEYAALRGQLLGRAANPRQDQGIFS